MPAISWPTAAIVLGALAVLGVLAWRDPAAITPAIVGILGTFGAAVAPKLLASKPGGAS